MRRRAALLLPAALLALAAPAAAEGPPKPETSERPAEDDAREGAARTSTPTPPPPSDADAAGREAAKAPSAHDLGIPDRTDPAASRGPNACPERIQALAPASGVGRTATASPVLYFLLDEATSCRIELVLNDPRQTAPRFEGELPGPHAAGVHAVSLAAFGVRLEPGVVYRWFVQIVPDPSARAKDVFSGGPIEHTPEAEGELWYDALAERGRQIAVAPEDATAREAWRSLLAAQGLESGPAPTGRDVAAGPPR